MRCLARWSVRVGTKNVGKPTNTWWQSTTFQWEQKKYCLIYPILGTPKLGWGTFSHLPRFEFENYAKISLWLNILHLYPQAFIKEPLQEKWLTFWPNQTKLPPWLHKGSVGFSGVFQTFHTDFNAFLNYLNALTRLCMFSIWVPPFFFLSLFCPILKGILSFTFANTVIWHCLAKEHGGKAQQCYVHSYWSHLSHICVGLTINGPHTCARGVVEKWLVGAFLDLLLLFPDSGEASEERKITLSFIYNI